MPLKAWREFEKLKVLTNASSLEDAVFEILFTQGQKQIDRMKKCKYMYIPNFERSVVFCFIQRY